MRKLRAWFMRLAALLNTDGQDRELAEELESHIRMHTEDNLRAGMSREAARRAALIDLGGIEQVKEEYRERRGIRWLDELRLDLRYGMRTLARSRAFTLAAVLTLAIGIGSTTAIFTVVHASLFPEYPFRDPDRVVRVSSDSLKDAEDSGRAPSLVSYRDWRRDNEVFSQLVAYRRSSMSWVDQGEPARVLGGAATAEIFRMAEIQPALGRDFDPDADQPGKGNEVILGHAFWQRRYGDDPAVIGRTVSINNRPFTIVGVMPASMGFPFADTNFWIPWVIEEDPARASTMPGAGFLVVGRLKEGISIAQAKTAMNLLEARLAISSAKIRSRFGVGLKVWTDFASPMDPPVVWTLFGGVLCVLLVACVNVANLLLARASMRAREMALRAALGASRTRIVRYLLTESLLLSLLGGSVGILLAYLGVSLFVAWKPPAVPGPVEASLNPAVLVFAVGASVLTALLFGLPPALAASRPNLVAALKESAATAPSPSTKRNRSILVIAEVALALVLLAGAGLMINSFLRLENVELGFDPRNVLAFRVANPVANPGASLNQDGEENRARFTNDLLRRLRALPQIRSVAASSMFPLDRSASYTSASAEKDPAKPRWQAVEPVGSTAGYFEAMRIPVLRGRAFTDRDDVGNAAVVILSRKAAQQFFPGVDPIGGKLLLRTETVPREVIGVVGDARYRALQTEYGPKVYVPAGGDWMMGAVTFVVRAEHDPRALVPALKREVWAMDARAPVEILTMKDLYEPHLATTRFYLGIFGFFAFVAVSMAAIGLYGLINYSAAQRTHEIGIRMTLGAQSADVVGMLLGNAALLALTGIVLGITGAFWLTAYMKTFLFAVRPADVLTFATVSAVLFSVALLASLIPARRASRVDPAVALKYE